MIETIRLVAGGLLALCCCYGGVMVKKHYSERQRFYRDASDFVSALSSEMSFKKTPLPEVIEKYSFQKKGVFVKMLTDFLAAKRKGEKLEEMLKNIDAPHLKAAEKKNVLSFLHDLGTNSLDDELASLSRAGKEFETQEKKCAEESKKLGGMYFKLAVLLGIALIIILA